MARTLFRRQLVFESSERIKPAYDYDRVNSKAFRTTLNRKYNSLARISHTTDGGKPILSAAGPAPRMFVAPKALSMSAIFWVSVGL